ncbi:MAG: hypothetical protein QME52_11230 [Bacteroidota bacterium]|nr:hypothetical protein [Bacteroidota bacterium]
MNFLKIICFASGLFLVTLVTRKLQHKPEFVKNPDKRYNIDDFLTDEEL